jgi:hypothetical protein
MFETKADHLEVQPTNKSSLFLVATAAVSGDIENNPGPDPKLVQPVEIEISRD